MTPLQEGNAERCIIRDCMDYIATDTSCTTEGDAPGKEQPESCTCIISKMSMDITNV